MRISLIVLLFVLSLHPSFAADGQKTSFRGIWVITWEIYQKNGATLKGQELKNNIDKILDNVQLAGLNAVIWQVRQSGTAYYPSSFEPWGRYLANENPGFDPVLYALEGAHKRKLEFHAWFNSFEATSTHPKALAAKHPEWIATDKNGVPLPKMFAISPGIAEARQYLAELIGEFAEKYAVDGIHLDYIRWSEHRWSDMNIKSAEEGEHKAAAGYGEFLYDQKHPFAGGTPDGFASFDDWRRDAVTQSVKLISQTVQTARPDAILSVAAIGKYNWGIWNGYSAVFQDAALWLNEGWIGQIMAMNYNWTTAAEMTGGLDQKCPNCWHDFLLQGLQNGGKFSAGIGSLMLRNQNIWNNHPSIVKSIENTPWAAGMQFFSYGDWEKIDFFKKSKEQFGW